MSQGRGGDDRVPPVSPNHGLHSAIAPPHHTCLHQCPRVLHGPVQLGGTSLSPSIVEQRCLPVLRSGGALRSLVSAVAKRLGSSVLCSVLASTASYHSPTSQPVLPGTILWGEGSLLVLLLVDSGADNPFIDEILAKRSGLLHVELLQPRVVQDLDGRTLATEWFRTVSLALISLATTGSRSSFFFFKFGRHNPQFDWSTGTFTAWSVPCHARCLCSVQPPAPQVAQAPSPEFDLLGVPEVYNDLEEVFTALS